jgi:SOS regulatory protein LexA
MLDERLNQVKGFYKKFRRLPSYAEMLSLFDLASKNAIYKIVQPWLENGFLEKANRKLAPTKKFFQLPLLGLVNAGFPQAADQVVDFMSLNDFLVDKPQETFLLKVTGDSLKDIGIFEDDLVVIEKKQNALPREIVLAFLDNEWTLKIFQKKGRKVFLQAANKKYPSFYPKQDLRIFGVVKGVVRRI